MNNLLIMPIAIPLFAGLIMVLFRKNVRFQRWGSLFSLGAVTFISMWLVAHIEKEGIVTLSLGGWPAPYGISLVADMFSMLLVVTASVVSIVCLLYSFYSIGEGREKYYFYPFVQFLLIGINGSFLTGDLFNLFVCFEVMLIASYVLIVMGGTKGQLRHSIGYILINIISSLFFLVAIAYLYALVGTLNFAHLSVRVAEVNQGGLLTTVAILFLVVFGLKAGLFLYFWLPSSYSAPPTAVAALFAALLTKVGIYAIFRLFTLVFYHEPEVTHMFIAMMAGVTMILGGLGAVAHNDIKKILAYNVIIAVGFIMSGLVYVTTSAFIGSIYYLLHDMIIKALIFLLGGTVIHVVGTSKLKKFSGLIRTQPWLGWMFLIASLSLAGIPPLSGFIGKIFITEGAFEAGHYILGSIGLLTTLLILYSLMNVFMNGFWGESTGIEQTETRSTKGLLFPLTMLTMLTIFLGIGAESISPYVNQAAIELLNPKLYIEAVLFE